MIARRDAHHCAPLHLGGPAHLVATFASLAPLHIGGFLWTLGSVPRSD
jgi:hypothetical protein